MEVQTVRGRMLLATACLVLFLGVLVGLGSAAETHASGEPQWIWASSPEGTDSPPPTCYFRKTLELTNVESARVFMACDDRYELYVNGRRIGLGDNWKRLESYDIRKLLVQGRNVIAVKAENVSGSSAGLVAHVMIKRPGHTDVSYSTDSSWKVTTRGAQGWERTYFNDAGWQPAQSLGEFGNTLPWGDQVVAADGSQGKRFSVVRDFRVERVLRSQVSGSVIAMAFNEWGEILAARESGPLLLVVDKNKDGVPETATTYCDKVTSCQGILALNGDVFAVGTGPDGAALYRLRDEDGDGQAENVKAIVQFEQPMGEHGPHAVVLGPDGSLYVMVGNHAAAKHPYDPRSPYHHPYEGDLPLPRYEDANGHAAGIKSPGGTVIRTDPEGSFVELYAGGLRNAYDMAFDSRGTLFTCDSDMEWDMGLPWYRPTRVNQLVAGAECGWRSGWAPWPDYYLDSLPATINTDRGSPTGVETYHHYAFPAHYHGAMFVGDWSQGQILAVHLRPSGAGYEAKSEVFLRGRPLNITDMAVGPDGWLYFSLGGRGTEGGIYRVVWTGKSTPPSMPTQIAKAIRQPQPSSAWARQRIASIQESLGANWGRQLLGIVEDPLSRVEDRCRAIDIMRLYGPMLDGGRLLKLTHDPHPAIRAQVAAILATEPCEGAGSRLTAMLRDTSGEVRRAACEAIVRGGYQVPAEALLPVLADSDRFVAFSARRALEKMPTGKWKDLVLKSDRQRVLLVGATALLTVSTEKDDALAVTKRARALMEGYLSDSDFVDLLRVVELAVVRGKLTGADLPELRHALAQEYPASESRMNRELLRLLAQLGESSVIPRLLEELSGSAPSVEKIHTAFMGRFFQAGWTTAEKLELVRFFEKTREMEGGFSFAGYLENAARDFSKTFSEEERDRVLAKAGELPGAALSILAVLPEHPDPDVIRRLIALDRELAGNTATAALRLRTGIVAVLGRSADDASLEYLRSRYESEPDRRQELAIGLAQSPAGENWYLLLRSLPILEDVSAQEVLMQLASVDKRPDGPEPVRQVILCGLRLGQDGSEHALKLLEKWTGQNPAKADEPWDRKLAAWQTWFAKEYPDALPATLPRDTESTRWSSQELVDYLRGPEGSQGVARRGALVFEKAQCAKCHRMAGRGEAIGPDLSTVSQRFQQREILESVLYPSQVISDQYASKTIITRDGVTYTGMVGADGADAVMVLQASGHKARVRKSDIEEMRPSRKSAMPEGLLNTLSLEEIADLFAFLSSPTVDVPAASKPRPVAR